MNVKSSKVEPVKRQTSVTSSKTTKNDVKPRLVSSSSTVSNGSRSPFMSQKTSRHVSSSADREATKISSSSKWTGNFIHMVELRKKIMTFRSIIDLPPLSGCLSITNMMMRTMKDLHQICPGIIESSQILDMRRAEEDKLLEKFYNSLKAIGDSWINDHEWIIKQKYKNSSIGKNLSDRLVEKVLGALDGLIKEMNERLENDEMKNMTSPRVKTSRVRLESLGKKPMTPIPSSKDKDFSISVSNVPRNMRMETLVKLSPMDVKRLANQNLGQKEAQSSDHSNDERVKGKRSVTEKTEKAKEDVLEKEDSVVATPLPLPPGNAAIVAQPPLPMVVGEEMAAQAIPLPLPPGIAAIPVQPQLPMVVGEGVDAQPPPSPKNEALPLSQPLPIPAGEGRPPSPLPPPGKAIPPPSPLPMATGKGPAAAPPPPPGAKVRLGGKKITSKLKRSTQFGYLLKFLKEKIEGKSHEAKSHGGRGGNKGAPRKSPKQGMAEALNELTKKSPYLKKIEENVRMYMNSINKIKTEIIEFENKDITELLEFHHHVESVLKNLEDESKVLSRCEGFPYSKLDAIRMAVGLYSKLESIVIELKNWNIESPAKQHIDKTERYFAKMRIVIEDLDTIKVEEEKKFKANDIHFDLINILVQIKELMVDASSSCMEAALKETREAKTTAEKCEAKPSTKQNKTSVFAKTMWRAVQFAFKVYTFAGGHDDRADKLTKEVGEEIEQVLGTQ